MSLKTTAKNKEKTQNVFISRPMFLKNNFLIHLLYTYPIYVELIQRLPFKFHTRYFRSVNFILMFVLKSSILKHILKTLRDFSEMHFIATEISHLLFFLLNLFLPSFNFYQWQWLCQGDHLKELNHKISIRSLWHNKLAPNSTWRWKPQEKDF